MALLQRALARDAAFLRRAAPAASRRPAAVIQARRSVAVAAVEVESRASQSYDEFIDVGLLRDIEEPAAQAHCARMQRVAVPMRSWDDRELMTAFTGPTKPLDQYPADVPAVVLLHSFDSSNIEFRRLHPLLSETCPTYAVDLVGWGFTDHSHFSDPERECSPAIKREHLLAFLRSQGLGAQGRPVVLLGTSVGGAIALDFAIAHPKEVAKLVLVSAQCYIDGIGMMSKLPRPLAALGVSVLKQEWLRQAANEAAYHDKTAFATKDAMRCGRLHTHIEGWSDANCAFMRSGGYSLSQRVREVAANGTPTLVMWGREDKILEPSTAQRFTQDIPQARLVWVERCGHSPHLEQPAFMAQQVLGFALGKA